MPRLELISFDDGFCRTYLEQFKQYASVPDDSRDALLHQLLRSAVLRVQEFADTALATCTYRETVAVPANGVVRLYMGGGELVSVEAQDGTEARYDPLPGGRLQMFFRDREAVITYTTQPEEGDRERLLPTVFRYATALYDGEEASVLNSILREAV